MFKNACFFLFCGYIARYAPLKNKKTFYSCPIKTWRYKFKQLLSLLFCPYIKRDTLWSIPFQRTKVTNTIYKNK